MTDRVPTIIPPAENAACSTQRCPGRAPDPNPDRRRRRRCQLALRRRLPVEHPDREHAPGLCQSACSSFLTWCEERGLSLGTIRPYDVSLYIESRQQTHSAPDVKQQLAARSTYAVRLSHYRPEILPHNPAAAVRGPEARGEDRQDARARRQGMAKTDRMPFRPTPCEICGTEALIATLTYSVARIGAALKMTVADLRPQGAGWELRRHEKGGKHPASCRATTRWPRRCAPISTPLVSRRTARGFLFRTSKGHRGVELAEAPMGLEPDAWRMIRRKRATAVTAFSRRWAIIRFGAATGITAYLSNGGALEHAQEMAAHTESPRIPTKLYDRTKERLTQDEVERIRL